MSSSLETLLKQVFGFDAFRGQQQVIIESILAGQDTLAIMPTGAGKSLCYQLPALVRPGLAVVISPLIALMQDQVTALKQNGVKAAAFNSTLDYEAQRSLKLSVELGELDILYLSPERLNHGPFLTWLSQQSISLFAIDEAHCISQWGHDFRADYLALGQALTQFQGVPKIALTATADELTQQDIVARLGLNQANVFVSGFDRPNIQYHIKPKDKEKDQLLAFIKKEYPESCGIVYCSSRKKVESTAEWLQQQGINARPYHAGLSNEVRKQNQHAFNYAEDMVMVATIAFGMGVDKPNVRFVVHTNMPKSIEAYYQETGRAGRDGLAATALMLYSGHDLVRTLAMIDESDASFEQKQVNRYKFERLLAICELAGCRRQALLRYFGDELHKECGNCDTCLSPPQQFDGTQVVQKALSAIYRTGQRYATGYLIQILLGKVNDRVRQNNHQDLSVFGIGKELTEKQWKSVFRQMIAASLVQSDPVHQGLQLSESCRPILKGEAKIHLRHEPKQAAKAKRAAVEFDRAEDRELWQHLKTVRRQIAADLDIPPYMVFSDATLAEIVRIKPSNLAEFGRVSGVGKYKLQTFAEDFLNELTLVLP